MNYKTAIIIGIIALYGPLTIIKASESAAAEPINGAYTLLLPITTNHLRPDHTIRELQQPVRIAETESANIVYGGNLMYLILNNNPINSDPAESKPAYLTDLKILTHDLQKTRRNYLQAIVALMWYLYSEAINKGQAFTEGGFIILDKELKLYHFLMNYVRMVNPTITGTLDDPKLHSSTNPFAYSRDSSHWKPIQSRWRPYGIDMRFDNGEASQPILPAKKSHLLFNIVAEGDIARLFIKFEENGIYAGTTWQETVYNSSELIGHAFNYVRTRIPKQEKNIPAQIYENLLKPIFGSDDGPEARREHTSVEFARRCNEILTSETRLSAAARTQFYTALEKNGIAQLGQYVHNKPALWSDELHAKFAEYYLELSRQQDYPSIRKGCEVILGQNELFSSVYYHCTSIKDEKNALKAGLLHHILVQCRDTQSELDHRSETFALKIENKLPLSQDEIQEFQTCSSRLITQQRELQRQAREIIAQQI